VVEQSGLNLKKNRAGSNKVIKHWVVNRHFVIFVITEYFAMEQTTMRLRTVGGTCDLIRPPTCMHHILCTRHYALYFQ
jgi:hypothetical protein